ncbi:MAG: ABC transporter substrate-binding protein [Caldilineaceae bacterium]|nr:ABC transporter substrate-binding protein [Caldilineaceae bacterium]
MKRNTAWLALALVALLVLAACQPVQAPGELSGPQTYVLGVAQPFTGALGAFGSDFGRGIELAVEQMNAQLSAAGRPIQFTIASADTEGTGEGAARAVQTVVQSSGAQVVVGPLTTGEVLGAKQFADENKIVLVAPASSAPAGAIPDDYIFRVMYPPDTFAAQAFLQIALARGYEQMALLQVDDPFGNGLAEIFIEGFQAEGGGEVAVVKYAPDPTELSGEVTRLSAEVARLSPNGNTAVLCICFLGDAQKALQVASVDQTLATVDWLGAENLVNPEILSDPAHAAFLAQTRFTVVTTTQRLTPNTQPFIDAFTAKFGSAPGPFTNYAYDAANIAMLTILAAGNNGESVQSMLPFVANHYIGTAVQTYLDENGDQAIAYYSIQQVDEDGASFVEIGSYDGSSNTVTFN